jgi:hypothetical protein
MDRSAAILVCVCAFAVRAEEPKPVDASTLHHKVLCGYQGWFRCPGDGTKGGWRHWSSDGRKIEPAMLTFEMWPDLSEFGNDEKYEAPGFKYPDGSQAHLFSSVNAKTVDRHFDWMKQYGIDGVFLQRFVVEFRDPAIDTVLANVRKSAERTGRAWGLCYDLSGANTDRLFDQLTNDWKRLVDAEKVTSDGRYQHHNKKPVVFLWGFYSDRFGPDLANRILDFFQKDPKYGATVIGGCQWYWRREKDAEWAKVFRRFDVISPWNVGNFTKIGDVKHASTDYWKDDLAEAKKAGMSYLPVVYPGFAWSNLKGAAGAKNELPRLGGEFFWSQFHTAAKLGIDMAYVAMFDEVDEGTAILKVSNMPPSPGKFATYEGKPGDWYLRLTGEGTKLIRGAIPNSPAIPIQP